MVGWSPFFVKDVAGVSDDLRAVASQPEAVFKGQVVQGANAIQGSGDLFNRRRTGRRGDGGGKHGGTSMGSLRIADGGIWFLQGIYQKSISAG